MVLWLIALILSTLPCILAQEVSPRIVGGSPTGGGEYPYYIRWGGCGATLIHPDIALGAAHVSKHMVAHGLLYRYHNVSPILAVVCL